MFETDTIAAISTPLGEGGMGIVRLSGQRAIEIAEKIFLSPKEKKLSQAKSHSIHYGRIMDGETGMPIDEVLVSVMRAPNTYTREDTVEINCHGGALPLRRVLDLVLRCGARLAMPGEFTQRAFMNGRIDLVQAEAVIDLIRAKTDESKRIALDQLSGGLSRKIISIRDSLMEICAYVEAYIDFPEEEIELATETQMLGGMKSLRDELGRLGKTYEEGRFFRDGLSVAIVGKPNVGKSSLLNALLERERAIVTDVPGTTRDTIEEHLNIEGLPVRITDTAGIRESHVLPEQEGVSRSLKAIEGADLVIAVFDGSKEATTEDHEVIDRVRARNTIYVLNKSDVPLLFDRGAVPDGPVVSLSARNREGVPALKEGILHRALKGRCEPKEGILITNIRHKVLIEKSRDALGRAMEEMENHRPLEIIALNLREALDRLGEVVGAVTTEDILNKIFGDFCIGK